jgi:Rod binding domain-containing protein
MTNSISNVQGTTPAAASAQKRDPKLWDAAKQFESVLVEQLAQQMQQTAQPSDDDSGDDASTSAADGVYTQMLPGALARGVSDAGGLGLAQQIYDSMAQKQKAGSK